jgi:hypothetical protein
MIAAQPTYVPGRKPCCCFPSGATAVKISNVNGNTFRKSVKMANLQIGDEVIGPNSEIKSSKVHMFLDHNNGDEQLSSYLRVHTAPISDQDRERENCRNTCKSKSNTCPQAAHGTLTVSAGHLVIRSSSSEGNVGSGSELFDSSAYVFADALKVGDWVFVSPKSSGSTSPCDRKVRPQQISKIEDIFAAGTYSLRL